MRRREHLRLLRLLAVAALVLAALALAPAALVLALAALTLGGFLQAAHRQGVGACEREHGGWGKVVVGGEKRGGGQGEG